MSVLCVDLFIFFPYFGRKPNGNIESFGTATYLRHHRRYYGRNGNNTSAESRFTVLMHAFFNGISSRATDCEYVPMCVCVSFKSDTENNQLSEQKY